MKNIEMRRMNLHVDDSDDDDDDGDDDESRLVPADAGDMSTNS
jgi:hypothetical protein